MTAMSMRNGPAFGQTTPLPITELPKHFEGERVVMTVRERPPQSHGDGGQPEANPALFEQLRALRKRLADERGIPPYVIFHDRTLRHMAAALPTDRSGLLRIPGVGERKAADYGNLFLDVIAGYVQQTGAEAQPFAPPPPRERLRGELGSTVRETLRLFGDGLDLDEIARERNLARATIEGHLVDAMERGEPVDVGRLVNGEKRAAIEAAFEEIGSDILSPVMERLGEGYTYGELRLVRAAMMTPRPDLR